MAIARSNASKQAHADLTDDRVNAGSGAGKLVLMAADNSVIATYTLAGPAFGDATSGGLMTLNAVSNVSASGTGTVSKFELRDSDDNVELSGSVSMAGGGGDLILQNTAVVSGQTMTITTLAYQEG